MHLGHTISGVFEVEPRQFPRFTFCKSVFIGTTTLSCSELREFIEQHARNYNGDTYHLIAKNCNHLCNDICLRLTGNSIPGWVNRLAKIRSLCNRLLLEGLHVSVVQHEPNYQAYKGEKKRLRSSFCQLSGSVYNCLLPERLHVSAVRHEPDYQAYEGEKKRLRSSFCRLSTSLCNCLLPEGLHVSVV